MRHGLIAAVIGVALAAFAGALAAGKLLGVADAGAGPRAAVVQSDPSGFARGIVRLIAQNRYEQAWQRLHPSHKRVAPVSRYVFCEELSPIPGRLVSVTSGTAEDEPTTLSPGRVVAGKAVPVRIVLEDLATGESTAVSTIVHAIAVQGKWTWILRQDRLADYAAGRCTDAVPPPSP
jgi:hypothetical protein